MVPRCQQSGFSFVEILFAMLIVVTLYAVVLGPSKEYVQRQKLQRCAENLRKLHLTLSLYANEHDGVYPATAGARSSDEVFPLLIPRYSTDQSLFVCPGSGHAGYAYLMGLRKDTGGGTMLASDAQVNTDAKTEGMRVFSDTSGPGNNHGKAGGNILFADGHVETPGLQATHDLRLPPGATLLNPKP